MKNTFFSIKLSYVTDNTSEVILRHKYFQQLPATSANVKEEGASNFEWDVFRRVSRWDMSLKAFFYFDSDCLCLEVRFLFLPPFAEAGDGW